MSLWQMLFGFNGRLRRMHWWLVRVGVIAAAFVAVVAFGAVVAGIFGGSENVPEFIQGMVGLVVIVVYFAVLWIELALTVKRWHDRDKSGFWFLIVLIPIIGPIWALIELGFLDGTQGPNQYGPSPKGVGGADLARVFS